MIEWEDTTSVYGRSYLRVLQGVVGGSLKAVVWQQTNGEWKYQVRKADKITWQPSYFVDSEEHGKECALVDLVSLRMNHGDTN